MTVDIPFEQNSIESFIGLHSSSSTALVLSAKQHFAFNPPGEIPSWPSVRCNLWVLSIKYLIFASSLSIGDISTWYTPLLFITKWTIHVYWLYSTCVGGPAAPVHLAYKISNILLLTASSTYFRIKSLMFLRMFGYVWLCLVLDFDLR